MINAIIIDDEKMSRITLRKQLEMYCPSVEVIAEADNAMEANVLTRALKPDLVFLDVAMPGKNGIDFLKEQEEADFEVIFVTAHDKYVLQAIRFAAVDYLQKPVEENLLVTAVSNAARRIQQKSNRRHIETFLHNMKQQSGQYPMQLCIPSIKGFQVVDLIDIIYCEADNTYTNIHFKDGTKTLASRPLMDYEIMLQDLLFYRIHKSFLINMKQIKEYQKGEGGLVVMCNGKSLEVSRRKKEAFMNKMKEVFRY